MFHLKRGWRLGVKSRSARAHLYAMQEEGKGEVDISVLAWRVSRPTPVVCALLSVCWLMKWTLGLGNWFWLRLISLSLPLPPSGSCAPSLTFLTSSPSRAPFGSSRLFSLTGVESWSQNKGWEKERKKGRKKEKQQHKQGGKSCSGCPRLFGVMSLGTGEAVASFLSFFCLFHLTCEPNHLSLLRVSVPFFFKISWNLPSLVSRWLCLCTIRQLLRDYLCASCLMS